MSTSAAVRQATEADASAILDCLHAAFEPYRTEYTPAAFEATVLTQAALADRLRQSMVFVAVTATGHVVGTISVAVARDGGHVRGLAVRPERQGHGIAQQLLATVFAALRGLGCTRVTLETTAPLERAIRFYEAQGFVPTGRIRIFHDMALSEYARRLG
jgi:GNAT superfamily N-acetyltransferase